MRPLRPFRLNRLKKSYRLWSANRQDEAILPQHLQHLQHLQLSNRP